MSLADRVREEKRVRLFRAAEERRYFRKGRPLGISIARSLLAGDYDRARNDLWPAKLFRGFVRSVSWSVPEARALIAAIRVANERYGTNLSPREFGL